MSVTKEQQALADAYKVERDDDKADQLLVEVSNERWKQQQKFGPQHHLRDRIAPGELDIYKVEADWCRAECDKHAADGGASWTDILLEETFEALAESEPAKLRAELVQVAAVAMAWVEAIDRRGEV